MNGGSDTRIADRSALKPGTPRDALRFFVRSGLVPEESLDPSSGRVVPQEVQRRLRFIQRAQGVGFALHEIRDLLAISDGVPIGTTPLCASIADQIEAVEEKLVTLMRMRQALLQMQERHGRHGRHGGRQGCPILAALQDESGG